MIITLYNPVPFDFAYLQSHTFLPDFMFFESGVLSILFSGESRGPNRGVALLYIRSPDPRPSSIWHIIDRLGVRVITEVLLPLSYSSPLHRNLASALLPRFRTAAQFSLTFSQREYASNP